MSTSTARCTVTSAILLLLGLVAPTVAQVPYQVVSYPLRLIDLSVVADTVVGLQVLVQPGITTKQGGAGGALVWIRFDPDSVLEWLNGAAVALRTPAPSTASKGIQWSRTLQPIGGGGGLALGRSRKNQSLQRQHWLAIGDFAVGWQAEISATEADSLLHLLLALGSASRLDTTVSAPRDSTRVDTPVTVDHQVTPEWTGVPGRVVAQYVVGVDGRVERGSFTAFLASDPTLVDLAWTALQESTFHPALRAGHPVRQLVRQLIYWKGPRRRSCCPTCICP